MKYCDTCRSSYPGDFATCPKDQTALRSLTELLPGMVLRGKYEVLAKLGAGGMGAVYKARHVAFGELRAIKFLGSHLIGDQAYLARFRSEAVVARKLQHPNAVRVDDLDTTEDGRPFIVMEYAEGRSLGDVVRAEGALAIPRALDLVRQACAALGAAHALGIVHRDIKPDNMLLVKGPDGSEVLKVLDFGLAKIRDGFEGRDAQLSTQTGMVMGTPQYIAPEQARGLKGGEMDGRADLYSLGVVLYELVTGRLPFHADTPMGMILEHIQTLPTPPHEVRPDLGLPRALSAILMKALEKDPEDRYGSAEEFSQALEAFAKVTRPAMARSASRGASGEEEPTLLVPRGAAAARTAVPARTVERPASGPTRIRPTPGTPPRTPTVVLSPRDEELEGSSGGGFVFKLIGAAVLVVVALVGVKQMTARPPAEAPVASPTPGAPVAAAPVPAAVTATGRTDHEVRLEIEKLFFRSAPMRDARIQVDVTNGVVSLTGDVDSASTSALAEGLARSAGGVRAVYNSVRVPAPDVADASPAPPPTTAPPSAPVSQPPATQSAADDRRPRAEIHELLNKGRQQLEAGNMDAAKAIFEQVQRLEPDNPVAQEVLEHIRAGKGPPRGRPVGPQGPRP